MITLSNGHSFQFMAASGALAFDGRGWPWEWPLRWVGLFQPELFTIVTKTLTRHPRRGNLRWTHPWSVVKRIGNYGIANAIGLTNKGIEWWLHEVAPKISPSYKIIVSVEAEKEEEMTEMLRMLEETKILGVELNFSCPNSPERDTPSTSKILSLCETASKNSRFPLIAKLSYTHDYLTIARGLDSMERMEGISINSIPWRSFFADFPSPLEQFGGGGLSGKLVQPFTWKMVRELAQASKKPIIGPSVWDYGDIQKVLACGARAVSFGSVFVYYPWRPTLFVRRWLQSNHTPSPPQS